MKTPLLRKIVNQKIVPGSKEYEEIHLLKKENDRRVMKLNSQYRESKEINHFLSQITEQTIDESVNICLPFYTDFGKHITFGKHIFVNQNVTFVDLGGIIIEDNVLIGPMSRLVTVNHLIHPKERRGLYVQPIHINKNVWLGTNVTVLPGVTIGENSIISADATVTKDVPANVIMAGTPAKILKRITDE